MPNQQLLEYIRGQRALNVAKEQIIQALVGAGWQAKDVADAFVLLEPKAPAPAPVVVQTPVSSPVVQAFPVVERSPSIEVRPVMPIVTMPTSQPIIVESPVRSMQADIAIQEAAPTKSRFHLSGMKSLVYIVVAAILIGLCIGTAYAYVEKIGVFSKPPYTEKNLISGLLTKSARVQTSSYAGSLSLKAEPRDKDAQPFAIATSSSVDRASLFAFDAKRARDVQAILMALTMNIPYPSSLQAIGKKLSAGYTNPLNNAVDPKSMVLYSYALTPDKKDFKLTVTFDTAEAITAIKRSYGFATTTTLIKGQTVTFTKGSSNYFYLSATPPKPFFEQMQELAGYLPAEISATASLGATSDWTKKDNAEWKFNAKMSGDFGDLTYKFDAEALKKAGIYYLRINNMPSIFGSVSAYKGVWVKIDPKAATSTSSSYDFLSSITSRLPEIESDYKKNREEMTDLLKKAAAIADEEGLVSLKSPAVSETVDGRHLYRYDIAFKKNAVVSFAKRLLAEVKETSSGENLFIDQALVDYLESPEFDQVFAYYDENVTFTLWVDQDGFPAMSEYSMRLVPPDTAKGLKGKQIRLIFKGVSSDINKSVDIQAPKDTKSIEEVVASVTGMSLDEARSKGNDASVKANLATILTQSSLYYDENTSYGVSNVGASASCSAAKTLFTDPNIVAAIAKADADNGTGTVMCASSKTAFMVAAQITDKTYWCVDSAGYKKVEATAPAKGSTKCP